MRFISIPVFIISLAIGLLLVYLFNPDPTVIYVYPTPDNADQVLYKDSTNTCHQFDANETECPSNKNEIDNIPAQ